MMLEIAYFFFGFDVIFLVAGFVAFWDVSLIE
jgi:hypothetical protein